MGVSISRPRSAEDCNATTGRCRRGRTRPTGYVSHHDRHLPRPDRRRDARRGRPAPSPRPTPATACSSSANRPSRCADLRPSSAASTASRRAPAGHVARHRRPRAVRRRRPPMHDDCSSAEGRRRRPGRRRAATPRPATSPRRPGDPRPRGDGLTLGHARPTAPRPPGTGGGTPLQLLGRRMACASRAHPQTHPGSRPLGVREPTDVPRAPGPRSGAHSSHRSGGGIGPDRNAVVMSRAAHERPICGPRPP